PGRPGERGRGLIQYPCRHPVGVAFRRIVVAPDGESRGTCARWDDARSRTPQVAAGPPGRLERGKHADRRRGRACARSRAEVNGPPALFRGRSGFPPHRDPCEKAPVELNPFSYEFHENPYPIYRWLRDNAPLYRNDDLDFWALSRFTDVMAAFVDWATYSSVEGVLLERLDPKHLEMTPMILFLDPPPHARLRKLVSRVFTPRRVAEPEPFVREITVRLLDPLVAAGGGDFVKDFSTPLPMEVVFTLLGVPDEDRHQIREWTDVALARDPDSPDLPPRAI